MDTLYTFWDTIIPYRTESVLFFGRFELTTKLVFLGPTCAWVDTNRVILLELKL